MHLPFIPDEFTDFQRLADDNGWRGGHSHGSWYQHLGQNLWAEHFGAYKPIVDENNNVIGWEALETRWTYTQSRGNGWRPYYYLESTSFWQDLRPFGGDVHTSDLKSQEAWEALFRA